MSSLNPHVTMIMIYCYLIFSSKKKKHPKRPGPGIFTQTKCDNPEGETHSRGEGDLFVNKKEEKLQGSPSKCL